MQLQELSKNTEERLASLNALAEHVSQKAKALEAQKHAVERAVVEANRLNEMVWAMDVQIAKLNEGSKQVARAEDTVARMEKLAQETTAQELGRDHRARDEFAREFARLDKESRALSEYLKTTVERLAVDKKEIRSRSIIACRRCRGAVDRIGRRAWTACWPRTSSCRDERSAPMRAEQAFQTLMAQADEMARKQGALEALGDTAGAGRRAWAAARRRSTKR